jgi:hypothetical protein
MPEKTTRLDKPRNKRSREAPASIISPSNNTSPAMEDTSRGLISKISIHKTYRKLEYDKHLYA